MSVLRPISAWFAWSLLAALVLSGCSSFDSASNRVAGMVTPYKIDIVQGNVVTSEQLAAVKPGMPKAQVRDIMGTALLASVFHANRWDYVFTLKSQGVASQSRRVTVFFTKDDLVERMQADTLPSEAEFVASLKSPVAKKTPPILVASEEMLQKYPAPSKPVVAAPVLAAPVEYPPLEPARR